VSHATLTTGIVDGNVAGGPRILVVDNYDSFVYNLVQYVGEVAGEVAVRRNDTVDLDGIRALDPDGIVLSPGPGTPASAGVSMDVFDLDCPIFGVCLGHQAMCAARGSRVGHAPSVVHGKSSTISHDGGGCLRASTANSASAATTRCVSSAATCQIRWSKPPTRPTNARSSWASATAIDHSSASSSTPKAF